MMAKKTRATARIRRHKRVRKHISGTAERPRLSVFRSLSQTYAQLIDDERGVTLAAASTLDSEIRGRLADLKKSEQARLVGEELARRAAAKGITAVVFDRGGFRYMGRVKALAEGARSGGLIF